jgi:hypothetical protein
MNEEEIRQSLQASRVVPTGVADPHGPLGLEHLAAAVTRSSSPRRPGHYCFRALGWLVAAVVVLAAIWLGAVLIRGVP